MLQTIKRHLRLWVQVLFTALTNGYLLGFTKGKIYRGPSKQVCVPGLNCYSCPGAVGSCPIGSLQAVVGGKDFRFPFYVIGFLMIVGSLMGRFVCGWLCPFGLVQDLLHKIPVPKLRRVPGDGVLRSMWSWRCSSLVCPWWSGAAAATPAPGSASSSAPRARCWAASPWWP